MDLNMTHVQNNTNSVHKKETDRCPICLAQLKESTKRIIAEDGAIYCVSCIKKWSETKKTSPVTRIDINEKNWIDIKKLSHAQLGLISSESTLLTETNLTESTISELAVPDLAVSD